MTMSPSPHREPPLGLGSLRVPGILTELLRRCRDAETCLATASADAPNRWMAGRLAALADERRLVCRELLAAGARFDLAGSVDGVNGIAGQQDFPLIAAAKAEEAAVALFVRTLERPLPPGVEAVLRRQYARVLAARDELRRLRDTAG